MACKTWTIEVDGNRHNVGIEHGFWSGKRVITLDGNTIERSRKLIDTGSEHRFDVDGQPCILKVRSSAFSFDFELFVDGRLV